MTTPDTAGALKPVAWAAFTPEGHVRLWSFDAAWPKQWAAETGNTVEPIYRRPSVDPGVVERVRAWLAVFNASSANNIPVQLTLQDSDALYLDLRALLSALEGEGK